MFHLQTNMDFNDDAVAEEIPSGGEEVNLYID
jgi:hypothetical protein